MSLFPSPNVLDSPPSCFLSLYLCNFIQVAAESKDAPGDFAVFVPYPYLGPVAEALKGSKVCYESSEASSVSIFIPDGILEVFIAGFLLGEYVFRERIPKGSRDSLKIDSA